MRVAQRACRIASILVPLWDPIVVCFRNRQSRKRPERSLGFLRCGLGTMADVGKSDIAFLQACMSGDVLSAKRLYTPQRAKHVDSNGQQAIHWACFGGQLEIVQWLSSLGVSLNVENHEGGQPILFACAGGHLSLAQWLNGHGVALNVSNKNGIQPIHYACLGGHLLVVQWLDARGVPLDARVKDGQQPIHSACYGGHVAIVKWLHARGISLDVESDDGHTPRTIAEQFKHTELLAWLAVQDAVNASRPPPPLQQPSVKPNKPSKPSQNSNPHIQQKKSQALQEQSQTPASVLTPSSVLATAADSSPTAADSSPKTRSTLPVPAAPPSSWLVSCGLCASPRDSTKSSFLEPGQGRTVSLWNPTTWFG